MKFYTGSDDCKWITDTHLKGMSYPDFRSFVLTGNEDCPFKIELYASEIPDWNDENDRPLVIYRLNDDLTYRRIG